MEFTFNVLKNIRGFFKNYLEKHSLETLNKIPEGFNNNMIWNIGHCIVTEQLLVYKLSGLPPMINEELIQAYKKGTFPKKVISYEEVQIIKSALFSTIEQTKIDFDKGAFKAFSKYTVSTTGNTLTNVSQAIEFSLVHESLHLGYIMALDRALKR